MQKHEIFSLITLAGTLHLNGSDSSIELSCVVLFKIVLSATVVFKWFLLIKSGSKKVKKDCLNEKHANAERDPFTVLRVSLKQKAEFSLCQDSCSGNNNTNWALQGLDVNFISNFR